MAGLMEMEQPDGLMRGSILPFGKDAAGNVVMAWPQGLMDIWRGVQAIGSGVSPMERGESGVLQPSQAGIEDAFNVAGGVTLGAGAFPSGGLRSGIKTMNALKAWDDLQKAIKEAQEKFDYVGIRTAENAIDPTERSFRWEDGDITDEMLEGLSSTSAGDIQSVYDMHIGRNTKKGYYFGDYVGVLGANAASEGEDLSEIVLKNPELLFQVKVDRGR